MTTGCVRSTLEPEHRLMIQESMQCKHRGLLISASLVMVLTKELSSTIVKDLILSFKFLEGCYQAWHQVCGCLSH